MIIKLICPDCKKKLNISLKEIQCTSCRRKFNKIEGIPILLPKNLPEFKNIEMNFYKKEFHNQNESYFLEAKESRKSFGLLNYLEFIEFLPKEAKILEICAGTGREGLIVRSLGYHNVVISDISPSGLIAAKKYSNAKDSFFVFDAENIPFEDNMFDAVFISAALHHLPNPEKGISEMKRCVKPGGLIIIALEPNSWYFYIVRPLAKLLKIRKINSSKDSFSIADEKTTGFSLSALKMYFRKENIRIVKTQRVWYLTGIVFYLPDLLRRLFDINTSTSKMVRKSSLKIDKIISQIPIVSSLSFHNSIIGRKVN